MHRCLREERICTEMVSTHGALRGFPERQIQSAARLRCI